MIPANATNVSPAPDGSLRKGPASAVRCVPGIAPDVNKNRTKSDGSLLGKALTPVEKLVVALLPRPDKIIAHELKISPKTVQVHMYRARKKTGADNRAELAVMADRALRQAA